MLSKLSEDIAECFEHAEECAQKAKIERDARARQEYLDMELFLARSYEFSERLNLLSNELDGRSSNRRKPSVG